MPFSHAFSLGGACLFSQHHPCQFILIPPSPPPNLLPCVALADSPDNMTVPSGYQQQPPQGAQPNGFANSMNNLQSKPMNLQPGQQHVQQPLASGNGFAGQNGVNQFQNVPLQQPVHVQPQPQPVAPSSAPLFAAAPPPQQAQPPAKPATPVAPSNPPVVDLTASSDDSPKGAPRDLEMDIDATPFDNLGSSSSKAAPRRPASMKVIPQVSSRLEVPRVPPNFAVPRAISPEAADSSSIVKPPPARPLKRPAPTSKHTWLGPAIPNDKNLGELAPLLTAGALQREKPALVFKRLRRRGDDDELPPLFQPTPQQLILIVDRLEKGASNTYLRLMADNDRYTMVIVDWIRTMIKDPVLYEAGIISLFKLLSRTNMPVNYIKYHRVLALTQKLRDRAEEKGKYSLHRKGLADSPGLASMPDIERAYNRYYNYVRDDLIRNNRRVGDDDSSDDEPATKKRKTDAKPEVKTETKPDVKPTTTTASKTGSARTDMSFFSGPKTDAKPKPKALPSFKKRPAPLVTPTTVAGPSSRPAGASSLLASTMKKLKKESPPPPAVPPTAANPLTKPPTKPETGGVKLNRKGHTVRWVDDAPDYSPTGDRPLVAVREFTEAPHELEPAPWKSDDVSWNFDTSPRLLLTRQVHGFSVHQMNRQEGNVMHHRVYDEVEPAMDWYEPSPYDAPQFGPPETTAEAAAQEQRERAILAVSYVSGQEPITPDDIGVRVIEADSNTRQMYADEQFPAGGDMGVDPIAPAVPSIAPAAPSVSTTVQDLLKNLNPTLLSAAATAPPVQPTPTYGGGYDYTQSTAGYNYAQPSYGQPAHGQAPVQQPAHAPANRWDQQPQTGYHASRPGPTRGGANWRGRGGYTPRGGAGGAHPPNYRTKTCRFWLEGRCLEGAACSFLHEHR